MSRINRFPKHSFNRIEPGHNPGPSRRGHAIKRFIRAALHTLVLLAIFQPLVAVANPATDLPGRVVAIWSKGAQKFVRSAGVDDGVLRADRDSYEANNEGRFLCFAEADGTFAFMDVMLERYLTHVGGQLTSAVTGAASTRRFTLVDQGNNYYALQADNGKHVRVDGAGDLVVDADTVTDAAVFSIVPIRTGPNVVMRAYGGDEADICSSNPGDFPVNKVNIGMLQMTPDLYTDPQFTDMRAVWNTNRYETEFILPYTENPDVTLTNQVDRLVNRIKRLEGLGYTFDYVILYHEILANLPGGPWSDPRVCSQEEIDLFHARVTAAHNAGEVNHPSYKVFTMPYQFADGSLMGIPPYQDTPVGCDAETLEFIKNNYDGMFLEVNGHDYSSRDEDSDAAAAAVWCRDNGLEFGITSGGANNKDANYKAMYGDIFTEMANAGFDKSWDKMHYVLHHVFQPYANRLPEWVANTTTENARWLIENVMPEEAPSITATLDTDGDGVPDLQEALDGTFPLESGTTPPTISAYSPMDESTGVLVPTDLVATFNQGITLTGAGTITLRDLESGPDVVITLPDDQVSASGSTLTISPSPSLEPLKDYAIQISATAITNLSGDPFGGINNDTTWNFSTVDASQLAFDDFSSYSDGNISGQAGAPIGFEAGAWVSTNGITATTVSGGVVTSSGNGYRTHRAMSPTIATGTIYIRTNLALGNVAGPFQALELTVAENDGDTNAVRLVGGPSLGISTTGGGTSATITTNDGANHEWLIELNFDTGVGQAWIDGNLAAFDPSTGATAFTASTGFAINAINIATFDGSGGASVVLDDIRIGESWSSIGVTLSSGPSNTFNDYITAFGLDPAEQGFALDPDNDHISNGLEAWFGTHPGEFTAGLADLTTDGPVTTFTHPQNATPPSDLTGYYEWSPNLTDWYTSGSGPGGGVIVAFSSSTTGTTTTVIATVSGAPDKVFLRAGVMQN